MALNHQRRVSSKGCVNAVLTRRVVALVAGILLTGAWACSDPRPPAAPTPVAPTITDTFTGTLPVSGQNSHSFAVKAVGDLSVSLTSVDPPAALQVGLGTPSGGSCDVISTALVVPEPTPQLSGTATIVGNLCVSVADAGNLVEAVNYTVSVLHP